MFQAKSLLSREAYLSQEMQGDKKHEFYQGQIFSMAGGTFKHAHIAGSLYAHLRWSLRGKPCQPMNSDMRVHTPSGLDTYPDVSVYCNQPELTDNDTTLLNPSVVFEVLSPTTRDYDRSGKFAHYRSIPGLQDYLLIDPEIVLLEHFHRLKQDEWLLHVYSDIRDTINLDSLGVVLALGDVYGE